MRSSSYHVWVRYPGETAWSKIAYGPRPFGAARIAARAWREDFRCSTMILLENRTPDDRPTVRAKRFGDRA